MMSLADLEKTQLAFRAALQSAMGYRVAAHSLVQKAVRLQRLRPGAAKAVEAFIDELLSEVEASR